MSAACGMSKGGVLTWREDPGGEHTCSGSQSVFDLLACVHGSELVSGELVLELKA